MSFNNALSGINAAQKDLNVTANNIANVNTTGFKESRAEFADVYDAIVERCLVLASSPGGVVYAVPGHPQIGESTM